MRLIRFFIISLFIISPLLAQEQQETRPPIHTGKVALELAGSAAGGVAFAFVGIAVAAYTSQTGNSSNGWDNIAYALLGGIIGYPIGCATGASLVGNFGNEQGNFWASLGMSAGGLLLGIGLASIVDSGDVTPYLIGIMPPVGAVLGHNLTRGYDTPPGSALLNLSNGRLYTSAPLFSVQRLPGYAKPALKMRLFDVRF